MKNLETLIQELCPDGVEFVKLGDCCNFRRGTTITAKNAVPGDVPVLAGGQKPAYYHNEANRIGKTIVVAGSGAYAGFVSYWDIPVFLSDSFSVEPDERLSVKFVFYFLKNIQQKIFSTKKGSGVPHVHGSSIAKFEIPLPPLEVQTEIVRILDKFTSLEAELEAELDCRKRQYEYYRDKLLSFENAGGQEVEWKKMSEIVTFKNGKGHEKSIDGNGKYIVVNSKFISTNGKVKKYTNSQLCPVYKNSILMVMSDLPKGRALAKCFLVNEDDKYSLNQRVCCFEIKDCTTLVKYLYFQLNRNRQLLRFDNGVDQTNLRKNDILNISIPIPPLAEQERIVSILDLFESLTTSLQSGLPAEIAARRQQYEYYRDKLLTFKRKTA